MRFITQVISRVMRMDRRKETMSNPRSNIYMTLGASNHTDKEREQDDYYATDSIAIDALLTKATLSRNVWECACGAGDLSKRLIEFGFKVRSTDLVYRGFGKGGIDFLQCDEPFDGDIITNPPYKYAQDFIEHALTLIPSGRRVFMFLRLQFLEGKARRKLFDTGQLRTVYVSSSRILCAKNGEFEKMRQSGGSAMACAWFEFEKGYDWKPVIEWIN